MVSSWISPKAYKGVSSRIAGRGLPALWGLPGVEYERFEYGGVPVEVWGDPYYAVTQRDTPIFPRPPMLSLSMFHYR
jgi:hypothetical protein